MSANDTYTKIFLRKLGESDNEFNVKSYKILWWQNPRSKSKGGLRLTDKGYRMLSEDLNISFYEVLYAPDLQFTTQMIIWLDNFIDCPYYLGKRSMFVTDDKKALELHLFSGDIKKFGISKALSKSKRG